MTRRRSTIGAGSLPMLLSLAACGPTINDDHCLFHGGDSACAQGQWCVVVEGGGVVDGAEDGCLDERAAMNPAADHVHVQYGLPPRELAETDDLLVSDSVQGILARVADDRGLSSSCWVEQMPPEFTASVAVDDMVRARARLDRQHRNRRANEDHSYITEDEADAIIAFSVEIAQWVLDCEASRVPPEPSGEEPDEPNEGTTGGDECLAHADCLDEARPFCDDGECVDCGQLGIRGDGECEAQDPATPVCAGGWCVECTADQADACGEATCDETTNTCAPCTHHDDCGPAACNLETGECLLPVVDVGSGEAHPTIESAVATVPAGASATIVIRSGLYEESIEIGSGRTMALVADEGSAPQWHGDGSPQLWVGNGTVFVRGLTFADNTLGTGIYVTGGSLWVDESRIVDNAVGLRIAADGMARLRNSMVGSSSTDQRGIVVQSASADLLATTVVGGNGPEGLAIECDPESSVVVRNSITVAPSGIDVSCFPAEVSYSATTTPYPGLGNHDVGFSESWFAAAIAGDLHLTTVGADALADVARWQAGDPTTDIDGRLRANVDGQHEHPGADIP